VLGIFFSASSEKTDGRATRPPTLSAQFSGTNGISSEMK